MDVNNNDVRSSRRYVIVCVLFILSAVYINFHQNISVPVNKPFSSFPTQYLNWKMSDESFMSDQVLSILRPTDYLLRSYINSTGERVTMYVGYHDGSKDSGGIHSPKHCLPGSGWYELSSQKTRLGLFPESINVVQSVYQKAEDREMFLYWFNVKGKALDNEYSLKLYEIINSALYRRKDAAFIRISVPFDYDEAVATNAGKAFIRDFYPVILSYLPR